MDFLFGAQEKGSKLNEYFSYDFTEEKIEEGKELKHMSCDNLNHIQRR